MKIQKGDRFWVADKGFGTVVRYVSSNEWYVKYDNHIDNIYSITTHPRKFVWVWVQDTKGVALGNGRRALEKI